MKVAASAKSNFRKALADNGLEWSPTDSQVDGIIRRIRSTVNCENPSTIAEEAQMMVRALSPAYLSLRGAEALDWMDSDQWSALLWDLFTAAASNTQTAARCPKLVESSEGWSDMVVLVIATPLPENVSVHSPFCYKRTTIPSVILAFALFLLWGTTFEFPGRYKFWLTTCGVFLLAAGEIWRRRGWNMFKTTTTLPRSFRQVNDDNASVASAGSSKLRAEHEALHWRIIELEKQVAGQ